VSSSLTLITQREGEDDACWQSGQPFWAAANSLMLTGGVLTGEIGDEAGCSYQRRLCWRPR
jgi:hypothetical protein